MDSVVAHFQGVVYTGRVRYAEVGGLDRLAEFFLSDVLPKEPRITELVAGFGLPASIVQDILGDLLRRGYASLDLEHGEIRAVPQVNTNLRRSYHLNSEVVKIWQDLLTGRFLPERMIAKFHFRPPNARVIHIPWDSQRPPLDFLDSPNTRVIASLNGADRSFLASTNPGWDIDAIVDRDRLGSFDIYMPIGRTVITGHSGAEDVVEYVQADQLPRWIKLAWTRALKRAQGGRLDHVALSQVYPVADASSPGLMDACLLELHADRWFEKLMHVLQASQGATSEVVWRHEQRAHAALVERLKEMAGTAIDFGPPQGAQSHVEELWKRATTYLLIGASDWSIDIVQRVLDATGPVEGRSPYLILLHAPGCGIDPGKVAQQLAPERKVLSPPSNHPLFVDLCLVDGAESRFAPPQVLLSEHSVLKIVGWAPTADVGIAINEDGGGTLARDLLSVSASRRDLLDTRSLHRLIERINDVQLEVDRTRTPQTSDDDVTGDSNDTPSLVGSGHGEPRSQEMSESALRKRAEELRSLLGAVSLEHPLLVTLQPGDLNDLLVEMLDRSRHEGPRARLEVLVQDKNDFWEAEGVIALVDKALSSHADIRFIGCPRPSDSARETMALTTTLARRHDSGHRIPVAASCAHIPPAILFHAGDIAIVAVGVVGDGSDGGISFAIRSLPLVQRLRAVVYGQGVHSDLASLALDRK